MLETLECLQQMFPFLKMYNTIVESEYRLNMLDLMEILIVLLSKELKSKQKSEEKSKIDDKKSKKNIKRKK
jgi:hypothetical protein